MLYKRYASLRGPSKTAWALFGSLTNNIKELSFFIGLVHWCVLGAYGMNQRTSFLNTLLLHWAILPMLKKQWQPDTRDLCATKWNVPTS